MSSMSAIQRILSDPRYHDYLAILKGARNGLVYGVKIRFPHALLMSILFGRGDWKTRARRIVAATLEHARNLASFVALYKTLLLVQRRLNGGKARTADTFVAGLVGGYVVFGDRTAVNEQIVLYVCSRVLASFIPRAGRASASVPPTTQGSPSLTPLASSPPSSSSPSPPPPAPALAHANIKPIPPDARLFSLFAALSWGAVMWLFNNRGHTIQPGMFSSMRYLYRDSERWNSLHTLLWHNK